MNDLGTPRLFMLPDTLGNAIRRRDDDIAGCGATAG
jgi:hypothetical protein